MSKAHAVTWGVLSVALALGGCKGPQVHPDDPTTGRFWEPLAASCVTTATTVECPKEIFKDSIKTGAKAISAGKKCCDSLKAEEERAGVRDAVYRGRIAEKDSRIERLELERWLWGAVGVAIGAVAVGVGMALAP